jgi:hypothetical protein
MQTITPFDTLNLRNMMLAQLLEDEPLVDDVEMLSLEEAGLEEDTRRQPLFGEPPHGFVECPTGGTLEYAAWFYDGDMSEIET